MKNRPIPYIASYTPTGLMTIAWDRTMQPYEKPKEIPKKKIVIGKTVFEETKKSGKSSSSLRRRLFDDLDQNDSDEGSAVEAWFQDAQNKEKQRVMLLNAL